MRALWLAALGLNAGLLAAIVIVWGAQWARRVWPAPSPRRTGRHAQEDTSRAVLRALSRCASRDAAVVASACAEVVAAGRAYGGAAAGLADAVRLQGDAQRLYLLWALREIMGACPEFVGVFVRDPAAEVRTLAMNVLAEEPAPGRPRADALADEHVTEMIAGALCDPAPAVRRAAVDAARVRRLAGFESLLLPLCADPAWDVRQLAVAQLAGEGSATVLDAVRDAMASFSRDEAERLLDALACYRGMVPTSLIEAARKPGATCRRECLAVLGAIAPADVATVLGDALKDSDREIRREAAAALGRLARRTGPLHDSATAALLDRLDAEPRGAVYEAVLDALEQSQHPSVGEALMRRIPGAPAASRERLLEAIALIEQLAEQRGSAPTSVIPSARKTGGRRHA